MVLLTTLDSEFIGFVKANLKTVSTAKFDRFIGNHPVDVTQERLRSLDPRSYEVTEKKDGLRVLLLRLEPKIECSCSKASSSTHRWIINDRRNCFYEMVAGSDKKSGVQGQQQEGKGCWKEASHWRISDVLDGELCWETAKETGVALETAFASASSNEGHIFDCLMIDGASVVSQSFLQRRKALSDRFELISNDRHWSESTKLFLKPTLPLRCLAKVDYAILQGWEGIMFYEAMAPYYLLSRADLMRWKPNHLTTVDLLVRRTSRKDRLQLLAWSGGEVFSECGIILVDELDLPSSKTSDIAEFSIGSEFSQWIFVRWRHDRLRPNHVDRVRQLKDLKNNCLGLHEVGISDQRFGQSKYFMLTPAPIFPRDYRISVESS